MKKRKLIIRNNKEKVFLPNQFALMVSVWYSKVEIDASKNGNPLNGMKTRQLIKYKS